MHKRNRTLKTKRIASLITMILVVSFVMQAVSVCCIAATDGLGVSSPSRVPGLSGNSSGIGKFDTDATIEQLKKDFLKSLNKDLLLKIEDYELTGEVGVILTFSDDSLIAEYENADTKGSYAAFRNSATAQKLLEKLEVKHEAIIDKLWDNRLITDVKYNYYHMLNGAYVTTTYEQIDEICEIDGVDHVMISNTYLPAVAVENPVNVYDTGIFNSGDVKYTGKGTVVAVLDTGCDYTHTAFTSHTVVDPKYSRDDIEAKLKDTMAYSYNGGLEAREVYYGNLTGGKIVFGYDYADKDANIMPFSSEHGTHVAGIIGGKDDTITGVAIDTQFAIMKVFSDYEQGAQDGDILAALEDSIILDVDAINMSLGSSCGFSREADDDYKNDVYDRIEAAGISLIVAASNDYSSGFGSEQGNTNKTDNPDSATVGSPASYDSAFTVASINGNKDKYMLANGNREIFFHEAVNQSAKEYDFFQMLGVTADKSVEYEYVTVPGYGLAINYAGLDIAGKIALVRRGEISFEEKVQFAYEAGAVAVIVYNNVFGDISMTVGNDVKIPVVSIGKDDGDAIAAFESGRITFNASNQAGPFMSDFSSWGPTPNLSLKPEITAHGGNILSAIPGGGYDKLSGTSMAAPNMCGIVVLIRQHVMEAYPDLSATEVRDLVNQLCMSTATIALDRKGNPYSPRKQGAGIADIAKATQTPAYLYVDGIGKTKLELGDDPTRSGVYEMTLNLKNLSDKAVSYRIGNITMTETVSSSDPEYVAEIGYLLSNASEYVVEGGTFANGVVSVEAGKAAKITIKLTLSAADKAYINSSFENGMYVEGYITFDNVDEKGVDLNAPFLAFYGDWSEAPIFDLDYYEVETEAHNDAIDDDDKIKADYYATTPIGSYYYDYMLPLGSYVYQMGPDDIAIPATEEKAAISYYADCINGIYGVFCGLLRGAKQLNISIVDTTTGEEVWSDTQYNCYKAHFNGSPFPYISDFKLQMADYETGEVFGYNNTRFEVTMSAVLDWEGARNSSDTYTFSFYIDYEAPTVTNATFRTEYDKSQKRNRYYADIMVYDNQYAMSIRPIIVYEYEGEDAELEDEKSKKTYSSLCEYPIPIYQNNRGEITKVTVEITDYIDLIKNSAMPEGLTVYIDDYAMNSGVCYIPFPETENSNLVFKSPDLAMDINDTLDLVTYLVCEGKEELETDYLKNLTWTSSDPSVVAIHGGKIEALKSGTATISVTGSEWTYKETVDGQEVEKPLYKTIVINVSENVSDNPDSAGKVQIEKLDFVSYKTLFAFNNDIDFSEIGLTGSINYFGGNNSISFYPSEKVQLYYNLEPWNLSHDRYELKWTSSNPKVATVDENGIVTAESEGKARITLQIIIDGKTSLLAARCSVTVKSEFVIENRTLIAYKGKGGDVVIPDDEGIMTIGAFAFSHYDLDNEKEVEKDEDGNYDMDDKKSPLGNSTVTSVVIPDGVETISKYAFYRCTKLSNVTIPDTCKTIAEYAFYECEVLENINLDKVQTISDYAFFKCDSLTCEDIGGINLSGVSSIGAYAFAKSRVKSVSLTNLSSSGIGAFLDCKYLETVVLGRKTRMAPQMFENAAVKTVTIYSDTVPNSAFKGCEKLTEVILKRDLTYLGEEAFSGCKRLKTVTFEGGCEEIAAFAFYDCTMLKSFTLPDCNVVVGDAAFADSSIETLIFGKNTYLESFGIGALEGVKGVAFDVSNSDVYKNVNGIIYSNDGTRLVLALPDANLGNFTVPAGVKEICDGAFSSNNTLMSVSFENGSLIEKIGYGAFANCGILMSVTLPSHNVEIGEFAFYEAKMLSNINLENITRIGEFAFYDTGLTNVVLSADDVVLGYGVFYNCLKLKNATLGKGATIGAYAFHGTPIETVTLMGDGVTVGESAFLECKKLKNFDFGKLTGKLGDYAFYGCEAITSVVMPYVTEIGEGCFADCYGLMVLKADRLEVVGVMAFAPGSEDAQSGAIFTEVYLPKLRVIGESAFYGCVYLKTIDLSSVEEIGVSAFASCMSLEKVVLPEALNELKELTFYQCIALTDINLDSVLRIGMGAFYGVPLPEHLELTKVEYIDSQAFVAMDDEIAMTLKSVNAPNLKYLGDQVFAGCVNLAEFKAPKLEHLGYGALAYTAIEEFEISSELNNIEFSIFEGNEKIKAFYAVVDGNKVYDHVFENVMIKDGVLYSATENGYVLSIYPSAKEDKEFTVADGTIRIEYTAAMNNKFIEKLILPESLKRIGNFAFFGCDNLKTVVFNSYYAPTLEGTVTGDVIEITPETVGEFPGFDKLYYYDYYYRASDIVATPFYYQNFVGAVSSKAASELVCVTPDNCEGYDSHIYSAYFTKSETDTSGEAIGKYALAFINAVNKLPEKADRFDKKLIDAAINAYNALEGKGEDKFIDAALVERFEKARSEYNVSVAENAIAHLFDMDKSEFSFERVKTAKALFDALTADEQAAVSNAQRLTDKIEELGAVMGVAPDFTKTFAAHYPEENTPTVPPEKDPEDTTDAPTPPDETEPKPWLIAIIVVASVLTVAVVVVAVVAGVTFLVVAIIKKSKKRSIE